MITRLRRYEERLRGKVGPLFGSQNHERVHRSPVTLVAIQIQVAEAMRAFV